MSREEHIKSFSDEIKLNNYHRSLSERELNIFRNYHDIVYRSSTHALKVIYGDSVIPIPDELFELMPTG